MLPRGVGLIMWGLVCFLSMVTGAINHLFPPEQGLQSQQDHSHCCRRDQFLGCCTKGWFVCAAGMHFVHVFIT